ncbi:MAG: peptidase M75 [Dysgonamonadaceae bacterium]|nr:peptidase M75 [Dysgonamonadaceae bacterium]
MQKFKLFYFLITTAFVASSFVACDNSDDDDNSFEEKENALKPAVTQYVNNTVIATYRSLADASIKLYEAIAALKEPDGKTEANLNAAVDAWFSSRKYWELSEAFLFGPVSDFDIDPHIDTWPLDEKALSDEMGNSGHIESMNAEDGDIWAAGTLGFSLLGFHGIEYVLFKDGSHKNLTDIQDKELIYIKAVAGDLRNQCVRLEAAWAGIDNVSEDKQALIEEKELKILTSSSPISYSENMLTAGKAGSLYRTVTDAAVTILEGCINISSEVGEIKIGNAHTKHDVNYIESPYSFNSKTDFADNIRSIANAYLGGADENSGASISNYIKSVNTQLDGKINASIKNCIEKIGDIPSPFVQNYESAEAGYAMEACDELTTLLTDARNELLK